MRYEKWSLGYWFLKQYIRFADWIINNKTVVLNSDKIPKDKPILFTPNHQNALSDPMAVLLNTRFQPVWLARADIFKNKRVASILRFLKIIPVYRLRDGKENLSKNDITFVTSVKVLENNGALALFPEAAHTGKRQMIPHKKAAPRIILMAEEKTGNNLDIQIVPTGLYYSSYWKFNRNLIVNFGDPIPALRFLKDHENNINAATLSMRKRIFEGIEKLVINIGSKNHYHDFEHIIEIYGVHFLLAENKKNSLVNLFVSNRNLAKKLDRLEADNPVEVSKLVKDVNRYISHFRKYKLRSWLMNEPENNLLKLIQNNMILIVGLPVFMYGFILNAIPFFLIDKLIRNKVKDVAFWSSFFLVFGIILFPVFYLLELLAFSWLIPGIWLKLAFLTSLPFAGKLAFKWYILFRKTMGRYRLLNLKMFNRKKYNQLLKQKEDLFHQLDSLLLP